MSDIERKLLSRLTDNNEMAFAWDQGLRADVFEEPVTQAIFTHMVAYWLDNHMQLAPTFEVVETDFPGVVLPREVDLATGWMIDHLKNRYLINRGQSVLMKAATELTEEPTATLRQLRESAHVLAETAAPRYNRVDMLSFQGRRDRYGVREEAGDGMTLGLPELDAHTGGAMPGELIAVAAFAKTGKSFFLVNAAVAARRMGFTPILFTLEMAISEMEDRVDALFSGVSYDRLSKGKLHKDEIKLWHEGQELLADMGPIHVERPDRGERTVQNMVNRARQLDADYILIDQLSFMDSTGRHDSLKGKHGEIVFSLKDEIANKAAGALPCLLAVQWNRDSQARGGKGRLENFANAAEIEQTVDLAIGLHRSDEMRINRSMQLDINGSRRSDLASWSLKWVLEEQSVISVRKRIEE